MQVLKYPLAIVVYARFSRVADIYCLLQIGLEKEQNNEMTQLGYIYYG